jgi:hypothetical protein
VDTLAVVGTNDGIGENSAFPEHEHGIRIATLCLLIAGVV